MKTIDKHLAEYRLRPTAMTEEEKEYFLAEQAKFQRESWTRAVSAPATWNAQAQQLTASPQTPVEGVEEKPREIADDPMFVTKVADHIASLQSDIARMGRERDDLETAAREMTKALTGLTANGSEYFVRVGENYYADTAKCVGYIRQRHETIHNSLVEAVTARNASDARVAELEGALKSLPDESRPDDLRAAGWCVAVHNDYRVDGKSHTFWLLTNADGRWVKGEGGTDAAALNQCRTALVAALPAGRE